MEFLRLLFDASDLVQCQIHQRVDGVAKTVGALGTPLQPQLENIIVSATLNDLVAGVVANVVQLVGHEQILGRHLVTADQQALQIDKYTHQYINQTRPLSAQTN